MVTLIRKLPLAIKALAELGPRQAWHYTRYQAGLRSGYYRWRTPAQQLEPLPVYPLCLDRVPLPASGSILEILNETQRHEVYSQADEVCSGQARLFGGPPVALRLIPPGPLLHWTAYGSLLTNPDTGEAEDIKWTWEPARCAWGIQLGRAAYLTGEARYAATFWEYVRLFGKANPPNLGPNWSSAQEIALRLISLCFSARLVSALQPPSEDDRALLSRLLASHAARIPLTLSYALAQNNNHLISEAAGLYTAGIVLPDHPAAAGWRRLGWEWFNRGLQAQLSADGGYIQNSANYHRLMLQLALWVNLLATFQNEKIPSVTLEKLAASTRWLLDLVDPDTGFVPNLGPNDSAYLFPLSSAAHADYRPVLQTASLAFLGKPAFPAGIWDEMALWLAPAFARSAELPAVAPEATGLLVLRPPESSTWAYLRAAHFINRPGHADQLHLDLWWQGWNFALDAGTYLYNSPPPWDNSLAYTAVHNTLMINGQEQMTRAGRFLWLDWDQAEALESQSEPANGQIWAVAQHDGYRKLGLLQRRKIVWDHESWLVEDQVIPYPGRSPRREVSVSAHWLMPDCPWQLLQESPLRLRLQAPYGWVLLTVENPAGNPMKPAQSHLQLVRAGRLLFGDGVVQPGWGWRSLNYGYKEPALSLRYSLEGEVPVRLIARWEFIPQNSGPSSWQDEGES